jgi:ubiquinol-cytochrome c reductase cytochrome b subunit
VSRLAAIWRWFDARLQIGGAIRDAAEHQVPTRSASWWYVFGSAALTVFMLQIFTGVMLAFIYVPSAAEAWNSLEHLNHSVTLGWFLRAVHGWGSNFMVGLVLIHMCQVALFGAYKFPRDSRRVPAVDGAGHGVYRPGHAFRPGCLLGLGDWRVHCRSRAAPR